MWAQPLRGSALLLLLGRHRAWCCAGSDWRQMLGDASKAITSRRGTVSVFRLGGAASTGMEIRLLLPDLGAQTHSMRLGASPPLLWPSLQCLRMSLWGCNTSVPDYLNDSKPESKSENCLDDVPTVPHHLLASRWKPYGPGWKLCFLMLRSHIYYLLALLCTWSHSHRSVFTVLRAAKKAYSVSVKIKTTQREADRKTQLKSKSLRAMAFLSNLGLLSKLYNCKGHQERL